MSVGTTNVLRTLIAAARERNNGIVTNCDVTLSRDFLFVIDPMVGVLA